MSDASGALAIETRDLALQFPGGFGVHGIDLRVPSGTVYGFLGPNGAGKTTTIRLLLGLLRPQRGQVALLGRPLTPTSREALGQVGALVESPSLYPHLSGHANLEVTRRLLGLTRGCSDEALARVGLAEAGSRRVREYSLGMRQRLALALALLARPRLLILDEPSNGLDPAGIQDMRRLLCQLAEEGLTVLVSSHLLSEVELIADEVGVLHAGRLVFQGHLAALRERAGARLLLRCDQPERALALLQARGARGERIDADTLALQAGEHAAAAINRWLVEAGIEVSHLARQAVSLESLFFDLTGAREVAA